MTTLILNIGNRLITQPLEASAYKFTRISRFLLELTFTIYHKRGDAIQISFDVDLPETDDKAFARELRYQLVKTYNGKDDAILAEIVRRSNVLAHSREEDIKAMPLLDFKSIKVKAAKPLKTRR